ncbi:cocaine esterase-like [Pollicipes pollicipes]|uniref:cocaine esterase-like n=1 Tax=Pollicipes pollicipes TaxID=41117 RepID=UPI001885634C|nr:cocaine esterase-like [Pollicipes pollicipes]
MADQLRRAPAVLLSLTLLLTAAAGYPDVQSRPLVATREGIVRGVARRSAAGGLFFGFKGIPYARAPLGPLRFQPPQRHPGWADVLDGLKHGRTCLQYNAFKSNSLEGDEDCLFANVYTPQLPALERAVGGLPVMVFIHAGGFTMGSGDEEIYGPNYFMDEAVVLVTFNYRLGSFGFFTTRDKNAPGNYGLLDQVMLLQGVRDNIARFGGDPATVTVFGTSAGGASVSLLVLSPLAKGLFHHAISQSAIGDRVFVVPMSEEVRLASLHAPVYKYVLDYRGPGRLSPAELFGIDAPIIDPSHGDDLVYLFSNAKQAAYPADSPTYTMIRFMVSLWTSFARTGRPSSTVLPTPDWPVFTEHSQRHMRLNAEPSVGERLFDERVRFWQSVRINEAWRHEVQTSCLPNGAEYGARRRRSAP